jgi:Fe-S-cluster containining protein
MSTFNLKKFKVTAQGKKRIFRTYLTRLEKRSVRGLDKMLVPIEAAVWQETDCLSCANCCKTMTPTFNKADMIRISAHLGQTVEEFQQKWLKKERGGERDWINKVEPCQFLNLEDNKCSIYEVRPADCSGFPHLTKRFSDYAHVHKQNIEYCPATFKLVEKMMKLIP